MIRTRLIGTILALIALAITAPMVTAGASSQLTLKATSGAQLDATTAVKLKLPRKVRALDGRAYFDQGALEFIGVAPANGGTTLSPVAIDGGVSFGAFDLKPSGRKTVLNLVVVPHKSGQIQLRIVVDSAANKYGTRVSLSQSTGTTTITIGSSKTTYSAPAGGASLDPVRAAGPARTLVGLQSIGRRDLDAARAAWADSRVNGSVCGASVSSADDANADGCIDAVDIQAVAAASGQGAALNPGVQMVSSQSASLDDSVVSTQNIKAAVTYSNTFTVTYAGDTPDASPGNGQCADSQGRCSLRAAMTESNWSHGPDLIRFNLSGTAPVQINLGSVLPFLNDGSGGTTIDGYSQPGSRVNTAQNGSNAIPGVMLVGTGNNPRTQIFYITSAGNVLRGLGLYNAWRPIVLNTPNAVGNTIVGNWLGVTASGSVPSYRSDVGIYFDQGPTSNIVGTADPADRNILANATKAIDFYGPGTNNNIIQNNAFCMTPTGGSATCSTAIDHDFGPKGTQIGGLGANEGNVMGPTLLNGVEISHGWDPAHQDTSNKWVNMNIHVEGNWIGFRIDGSYSSSYRSGLNNPGNADNGNGVNIYDGCSNNVVDGNYIASAYDGVNTMLATCHDNIIRNNTIGVSPQGQAAPMNWWGIHVRLSTSDDLIQDNVIRNATLGGIGLTSGGERRILISRNIVSNTNGPAIHLEPDSGAAAPGSNNLYPSPVITTATTTAVSGTGEAGSTVEVFEASRNAGQSGLPSAYLGTGTVAANGTWSIPITVAQNSRVTALQIASNGNTSELGTNVSTAYAPPPPAPVANFGWSQQGGNLAVDFTDTSTNTPTAWSWDFGDGATANTQDPTHTYAVAGDYTVQLTVSNGGGSDTRSRTVTVDPLSGATIYAADSFGRSATDSWGDADVGGSYAILNNSTNYSVASGVGSMVVPKAGALRAALLNSVSEQDVDISLRFSVDKAPSGQAYWIYAVARRDGTNEYRAKARLLADGRIGVQASRVLGNAESPIGSEVIVPGLTVTAGGFIWLHAQVTGSGTMTLKVNAWADGQSEPSGWLYSRTDTTAELQGAGGVGIRVYVGTNATTAPVEFSIDDYAVIAPQ